MRDCFSHKRLGPVTCLMLSDVASIHEAFSLRSEEFSARPDIISQATGMGNYGLVLLPPGPYHTHEKKKTMSLLRGLGVGTHKFDDVIIPYIQEIISMIGESPRVVDLRELCSHAMNDIIGGMIFGDSFYHEKSETSEKIRKLISENFRNNPVLILAGNYLPVKVKQLLAEYVDMENNLSKMQRLLHDMIRSLHHKEPKNTDSLNSFVSKYLEEYESSHDGKPLCGNPDEESQLVAIVIDFLQAGCETTAVSLQWLMLLLAANPHIQQKAQDEIDTVFGKDPPTLKEKKKLQYINAIIYEGLRIRPPAPLGAPHCTTRNVKYHGYTIPAGTPVLANYVSAHHNPKDFPDPHQFKPERFLGEDNSVNRLKSVLSFGTGPRICAGEQLARSIISSIIINILQKYKLTSKDETQVNLSFIDGINLVPRESRVFVCPR